MKRLPRVLLKLAAIVLACAVLLTTAVVLLLRSDWFHDKVRQRIVAEVEKATGGSVELEAFRFHWRALRAEVRGFTLRGKESADEPPLFSAQSFIVDLKVISLVRRDIDIARLGLGKPEIYIAFYPDGSTNVPQPKTPRRAGGRGIETFLRLAVQKFDLTQGHLQYANRRLPLDVKGERLRAEFSHDAAGPRYLGKFSSRQLLIESPKVLPIGFDLDLDWSLDGDSFDLASLRLALGGSSIDAAGSVAPLSAPALRLNTRGNFLMADFMPLLGLPLARRGRLDFKGLVALGGGAPHWLDGGISGSGFAYEEGRVRVTDIRLTSDLRATGSTFLLPNLSAQALEGGFTGEVSVDRFRSLRLRGQARSFPTGKLLESVSLKPLPWSGLVSGPLQLDWDFPNAPSPGAVVRAQLTLSAAPEGIPLAGEVSVTYDQRANSIRFAESQLATPLSRIRFSGSLRERLNADLFTRNLEDLLPAVSLFTDAPVESLPVKLDAGEARFEGYVDRALSGVRFSGRAALGPFLFAGQRIDEAAGGVELDRSGVRFQGASLRQRPAVIEGHGELEFADWKPTPGSRLSGNFRLRGLPLGRLLKDAGRELPVDGVLAGTVQLTGTVEAPDASARLSVERPTAYGERFDRLQTELRVTPTVVDVASLQLVALAGKLTLTGRYEHKPDDWLNGSMRFQAAGQGFTLAQWAAVRNLKEGLEGRLSWQASGSVEMADGRPQLNALTGDVRVRGLTLEARPLGSVEVTASTRGKILLARATAKISDSTIESSAEWSLEGESVGLGYIRFSRLTLAALQDVGLLGGPGRSLPAEGSFDGEVGFSGPVLQPGRWHGVARMTAFSLTPRLEALREHAAKLTVRNAAPLVFGIDPAGIHIQEARFVADGTDVEAFGTLAFRARGAWNFRLKGAINLQIVTLFNEDLMVTGVASLDASVRGTLSEPQFGGRMHLQDASFYLRGLPNGIEKASGTIHFDRNRATIEKLTSQTGGGDLTLAGHVGYRGELFYRLQARAERVRIRYPEGVSTSFNADLSLTGTPSRSLLSGDVSVIRAGFTPRTDIGGLLTQPVTPPSTPATSNEFLRGLQFDVGIRTTADAELLTTLTRDVMPEADLKLRGSPSNPVLLGRMTVDQGEIQFFGNRYNIIRGEVSFFNPVKIEPVLAMDLETRVRGIIVNINFSGPLNKLNFSYRSDPPLQSQEIIALLTVGRAPGSTATVAGAQSAQGQSFLQTGGDTLLGQAIAAPVSGRLQRFFGVSRLKIDPQLTGIDNTPQARLTIEQQLSPNITLTYITNLTRTQHQVVRVEWDLSREWSLLAVRDSNGIFGVDFVYRRRFR